MNLTAVFRIKLHSKDFYKYAVLTLKREGGVLVWYRRMGFWQYIYCYDSVKDALADYPEAVLSYRKIKVEATTLEVSVPYKDSDLKSKPALYNYEWFWVAFGSILLASCFMTGLFLIHLIEFYALLMIAPAIASIGITVIGYDTFVWR